MIICSQKLPLLHLKEIDLYKYTIDFPIKRE